MRPSFIISGLALALTMGCQPSAPATEPVTKPPHGGPRERLNDCISEAGISGKYETESWFDKGVETLSVLSGFGVSSDQADIANQCLAGGA